MEELGLTKEVDTLGRWMAHYVAELISESEKGSSSERKQKQAVAAQMILQLWQHRAEFPNGSRPLREFDSVLGVLQSLDLSNPRHRYFRVPESVAAKPLSKQSAQLLSTMSAIDRGARTMISYCLSTATEGDAGIAGEWISAADAAELEQDAQMRGIRIIVTNGNMPSVVDEVEVKRKKIDSALQVLKGLQAIAKVVSTELRSQRSSLSTKTPDGTRAD